MRLHHHLPSALACASLLSLTRLHRLRAVLKVVRVCRPRNRVFLGLAVVVCLAQVLIHLLIFLRAVTQLLSVTHHRFPPLRLGLSCRGHA